MKKNQKVRPRYPIRQKYIKWLRILSILGLIILFSPLFTHESISAPDEVSSNAFLNSKTMDLVSKQKGGESNLVLEFAIDDDDQNILKELSNLNYSVDVKTSKGNYQDIKAYVQSVTDEYLVVKMENVPKDYYAMRVNLNAEKIDKNVAMDLPVDLIYYIHQDKVTEKVTDEYYLSHFVAYKKQKLKDKQEAAEEEIKTLEAGIKLNDGLIEKLKGQVDYQTLEDQKVTEDKINTYNLDNESSKTEIAEQNEVIEKLQEKIDSISVENIKQSHSYKEDGGNN